jgi:transposase
MGLATELADWRRFGSARELMAYVGLVPREHSSGDRQRRRSITKAGNSHVRHVLVQAAWSYRFAPKVGVALKRRQEWQGPRVIAHAWKVQHRTYTVFHRLSAKRPPQIAVGAVAREWVGFLWAVMRDAPDAAALA